MKSFCKYSILFMVVAALSLTACKKEEAVEESAEVVEAAKEEAKVEKKEAKPEKKEAPKAEEKYAKTKEFMSLLDLMVDAASKDDCLAATGAIKGIPADKVNKAKVEAAAAAGKEPSSDDKKRIAAKMAIVTARGVTCPSYGVAAAKMTSPIPYAK
ncbi:MAG: hypothetical protein WC966_10585 [Bradymonadales bacterium]|jgi:hypothetical protein